MKITKILPYAATPAKALLARAKKLPLTTAERMRLPAEIELDGLSLEIPPEVARPVLVEEVLIDEKGAFYVVVPKEEQLFALSAPREILSQLAALLLNRGLLVEDGEDGVFVLPDEELRQALEDNGIGVSVVVRGFNPVRPAKPVHGHGEHCCCGHHHEGGDCGCGHHHHHEDGECGCGHDHQEGDCCCARHGQKG